MDNDCPNDCDLCAKLNLECSQVDPNRFQKAIEAKEREKDDTV